MSEQFIAILALKQPAKLVGETIVAEIQRHFANQIGLVSFVGGEAAGNVLTLQAGADLVTIMQIDRPVSAGTFDVAVASNFTWPNAKKALAEHSAHVIVAGLGKPQTLLNTGEY